jgi:lipid A 3-O-deacylase
MKVSIFILLLAIPLHAHEQPSHFFFSPGVFDVTRTHPKPMLQLEYRRDCNFHHIRPLVSAFVTSCGSCYLCGGAGVDLFFSKRCVVTPSFAPGLYYAGGGKDLGFPINFRSAIDIAFCFKNASRIGVQFQHISNAHLGHRNPGANSLVMFYALPIVPTMNR